MLREKRLFVLVVGAVLVGLLALTPTAASGQGQQKMGGAWLGIKAGGGHRWVGSIAPLDSAAREAALHVRFTVHSPLMAGLIGSHGADSFSEFVGEGRMMNRTTAQFTLVGYALKRSQLGQVPEIKLIFIAYGTWEFTDSAHAVLKYSINVYLAATDADGDGMPDAGSSPILPPVPVTDFALRVPILP